MGNRTIEELIKENAQLKKQLKDVSFINNTDFESPQEREKKFQNVFEKSTDALLIIKNNIFTDCNIATSKMLGYATKDEFLSLHPSKLSPKVQPDGQNSFRKAEEMIRLAFEKGSHRFEWIHTKKNGTHFPVEVSLTVITDKPNNKTVFCIWRDLTERKEADNKLAISTKQLQNEKDRIATILNLVKDPIFVKDNDHVITFANSAFCKMFDLDFNDVIGKNLAESVPEDEKIHFFKVDRDVLDTGISNQCEETLTLGDKTLTIITTKSRFIDESGKRFLVGSIHDISERKIAEENLEKSENEFRLLTESMPQIVWATQPDGWNIYFNQRWVDYTGMTLEESYGHGWIKPFHPDDQQKAWDAWQNAVTNYATYSIEARLRRYDGEYRWWLIRGTPQINDQSKILKWFGTCTDIDDIKKSEKELYESEQLLRLSTELANVAAWEYDYTTNRMSRSKNHDSLYGLDQQEHWEFETFVNATHPNDREKSNSIIQKSVEIGGPDKYNFEFRVMYPNQSIHWLNVIGEVIKRNELGEGIKVHGFIIDITEYKQAVEQLLLSEEKFSNAFHFSPAGLSITRISDGKFIDINDSFLKIFEFSRDEVIGHTSIEINMLDSESRAKLIKRQIEANGLNNIELETRSKTGKKIHLLFSSKPITIKDEACHVTTMIDITDHKQAQEELKEREVKFRTIFESANVGKSITLLTGEINVNEAFCNMLGYTHAELKTKKWQDLTPEDDIPIVEKKIEPLIKGKKKSTRFEKRYIKKDGTHVWGDISVSIQRDLKNNTPYFITTIVDITEHKKAEDELKRNEQILKLFVKHAPAAVAMFDKEMKYIVASDRFYIDYNLGDKKIIGHSHYEIFPEIPERWKKIHKDCLEGANIKDDNDSFLGLDGQMEWLKWEILPWYENEEEIGGIILFSEMITERKKTEEALKASQQYYYTLFNDSPIPLWEEDFSKVKMFIDALKKKGVKDFRTYFNSRPETVKECIKMLKIRNINKPVLELHEANTKDDLINGLSKTLTKKSLVAIKEQLIAIAENTKKFNLETETKTLKGNKKMIHLEWIVVPGYEESMEKVILCTTDITEIKKYRLHLETLVKKRTAELTIKNSDLIEEKRKVEDVNKELESFSYSVSHDLRAPLRHIDGFTTLLQKKLKDKLDEKGESYFKNIISSSLKMNQLIDDLLIYSRLGRTALNKVPVNMKDLIETVLQTFIFDIKKHNISIRVDDLPDVNADPFFMAQMWENLISNAIKFSSKTKHPKIYIGFEKDTQDSIIYFIKDNGAGFDQKYVANMFGVFQRLHSVNEFPGTGIGLATTKRIIMKHNGDIWAIGAVNKGASFYLKLPKT